MTRRLEAALAKLATLAPEDQDRVAEWLLDELRDEERWAQAFHRSQDTLSRLATEARTARTDGRTTPLDPDQL